MRHSKFDVLGAVAMVAVAAASAHAQSEAAQAETLFRHGKDLMARGQIAEACAAFDASEKLEPTIATLLNQASCREKNGQLATAWGLFLDAARQTRAATDDAGRQMHRSASERAARIEPRLSTLTITVLPENRVGGLEILRDGEVIEPGAWNRALPIDGATYRITARAPGNADRRAPPARAGGQAGSGRSRAEGGRAASFARRSAGAGRRDDRAGGDGGGLGAVEPDGLRSREA
ncbi:MAG: hypothetical protein E6J90_02280 [Deltaproteobacteria bacterium]|nr:MAG: hypothetical protein E6J90_02280 [Deltaproteobacteria bacterium]